MTETQERLNQKMIDTLRNQEVARMVQLVEAQQRLLEQLCDSRRDS